jgi:hypothetical protein
MSSTVSSFTEIAQSLPYTILESWVLVQELHGGGIARPVGIEEGSVLKVVLGLSTAPFLEVQLPGLTPGAGF